jgi:hypothetical protein
MTLLMKGNYIFVQRGQKAFKVASNFTNYLELGALGITEYYLEARIEEDAFMINATLLSPQGKLACRVVNNFPDRAGCRREMTPDGYRILTPEGQLLLGIAVRGDFCHLLGIVYDTKGNIVAQGLEDDFVIHQGPAVLGKSQTARGIVLS